MKLYLNKYYSIEEISKRTKVKESDIRVLLMQNKIKCEILYGRISIIGREAIKIKKEVELFRKGEKDGVKPKRKGQNKSMVSKS